MPVQFFGRAWASEHSALLFPPATVASLQALFLETATLQSVLIALPCCLHLPLQFEGVVLNKAHAA